MPVGPFVFWAGGSGAAPPPPLSADRFSPKYLVGNFSAGDLAATTSFGGFVYIQDPGDGSGVAAALAQPNGLGDVYVRPGNYVGSGILTVPAGVRVVGAGSSVTLFSGRTFVMDSKSTLAHIGVNTTTDFSVRSLAGASGIELQDVVLASSGGSGCMQFTGGGFTTPYPRPISIQRVACSLTIGGRGLHIRAGAVVSVDTLSITGGDESIRSESNATLLGRQIFTDNSDICIHYLGHTGLGSTSVQDSQFFSDGTTIVGDNNTANVAFTRCILRNVLGGTSMDFAGASLSNAVFNQCEILSTGLGIENVSGSRVSFLNCRMTSQSGANATLNVGIALFDVTVSGGSITNNGPGLISYTPITINDLEVVSSSGNTAASFFGPGGSVVTNSVFISSVVSGGVIFDSPNNVFSTSRVQGVVRYTGNAIGNTTTALLVNAIALGGPAILVDGKANVFTAVRTRTALAVPGVALSGPSEDNLVISLSAVGPGVGGVAVLDSGLGNEVAHIIST